MPDEPEEDKKRPPLFRQEAIDSAAGTQFGDALNAHWRGVGIFTGLAFLTLAALLVFVSVTEYAPVHRVEAFVDAPTGLIRLKSPLQGRVSRLAVEDGAAVRRGDLLAVLASDRQRLDGRGRAVALRESLDAERAMVLREVEAAKEEANASRVMVERRLHGLRAERETLRSDIVSAQQLLASLRIQSEQVASVAAQGYATQLQAAQRRDEVNAQESRVALARGALARTEREIETADAERRLVDAKLSAVIQNKQRSHGELDRLEVQNDADEEQAIRAPQDGVVSLASVADGQSVVTGQTIFTLAPAGGPLVLRLLVPPYAVASVRPGVEMRVVFRAYPQERFGTFAARVTRVNDTVSLASEVPHARTGTDPLFLAMASLPTEIRTPRGELLQLKAGMLADALVPIERRRVIEWLLDPIIRGLNDSVGRPGADTTPATH